MMVLSLSSFNAAVNKKLNSTLHFVLISFVVSAAFSLGLVTVFSSGDSLTALVFME